MGGREAQRRPPPARKRRSDGLPPADGRAPRPPCEAGLEEAMVAVGSTCAAAWPRRKAATLAVMTFNGPKGERVKLQLGLPRGIRNPSPSLLFSSPARQRAWRWRCVGSVQRWEASGAGGGVGGVKNDNGGGGGSVRVVVGFSLPPCLRIVAWQCVMSGINDTSAYA